MEHVGCQDSVLLILQLALRQESLSEFQRVNLLSVRVETFHFEERAKDARWAGTRMARFSMFALVSLCDMYAV